LRGTIDGFSKIVHFEGKLALWNGLRPTLVLQIPNTVVYLGAYEELRRYFAVKLPANMGWSAPALAGMLARTVAASAVAPLELVRTRRQAAMSWPHATVVGALRHIVRHEGCGVLFRGLGPTLLRDVPFSALYWFGIEALSARMRLNPPSQRLFSQQTPTPSSDLFDAWAIGFTAGATSGCFAALITTPFDVIKTTMQLDKRKIKGQRAFNARQTAVKVLAEDGVGGFFVGVAPRVGKVAPACAIMISVFELAKAVLARRGG